MIYGDRVSFKLIDNIKICRCIFSWFCQDIIEFWLCWSFFFNWLCYFPCLNNIQCTYSPITFISCFEASINEISMNEGENLNWKCFSLKYFFNYFGVLTSSMAVRSVTSDDGKLLFLSGILAELSLK